MEKWLDDVIDENIIKTEPCLAIPCFYLFEFVWDGFQNGVMHSAGPRESSPHGPPTFVSFYLTHSDSGSMAVRVNQWDLRRLVAGQPGAKVRSGRGGAASCLPTIPSPRAVCAASFY